MAPKGHLDHPGPTWDGPTSAPRATAPASSRPWACRKVSRCTPIIEAVTDPRVRTAASSRKARVRRAPVRMAADAASDALPDSLSSGLAAGRLGRTKACSGSETKTWSAA
jgi:hypothetical protein